MRKVLEALARRRPLVLVVDDLQWAEPTFIDLIEHVAEWTRDAPLLLLIMARPELLEARPGLGRRQAQRDDGAARAAARRRRARPPAPPRGTGAARRRARRRASSRVAEGNPLFVEEVVAMLIDDGVLASREGDGSSAPSCRRSRCRRRSRRCIAARLDRLGPGERAVIEARVDRGQGVRARAASRRWSATAAAEPWTSTCARSCARTSIRPVGRERGHLPLPPPADPRRRLRRHAQGAARRSARALRGRTGRGRRRGIPAADELLGYHLERAVLLRRELGATEAATAAAGGARVDQPARRRAARRPARRPGVGHGSWSGRWR